MTHAPNDTPASVAHLVAGHGPTIASDPVALASALRGLPQPPPEREIDALAAAAGCGTVERLRAGYTAGASAAEAVRQAADAVTGLPDDGPPPGWAVEVLGAAVGLLPAAPGFARPFGDGDPTRQIPRPRPPSDPRPGSPPGPPSPSSWPPPPAQWPPPAGRPPRALGPEPLPTRPRRRPRRLVIAGAATGAVAVVGVLVVALSGVLPLPERPDPGPPPPPRSYAVADVAGRYQALGSELLSSARKCAPMATEPGAVERVECDLGPYSLVLTEYDELPALLDARAAAVAVAESPESVRSGRTLADRAGFVMDQQRSGQSSVYWDATAPRPVSAALSANVGLPTLVEFYDERGFRIVQRPEVPGAAFESAALWEFAAPTADRPGIQCSAEIPDQEMVAEEVKCVAAGPSVRWYSLARRFSWLESARRVFTGSSMVPGTVKVGDWSRNSGPVEGQLTEAIDGKGGNPVIYYDQERTLCYSFWLGPAGLTQEQFRASWEADR